MPPSVSVIIPNYNKGPYIAECLQSCIDQGLEYLLEVIFVDDHSTDNSLEVVEAFRRRHPDIVKVFTNPRKGAAAARNVGFEQSTGEYIQWLDSDDILGTNKISIQVNFLENNKNNLCHCNWVRFSNNIEIENHIGEYGPHKNIKKRMMPIDFLCTDFNMVPLHAWLGERSLYENVGGWDENINYNDDGEFMYRCINSSESIDYINNTMVYYRSNMVDSLSRFDASKIESYFRSIETFENILINSIVDEKKLNVISNKYYEFIYQTAALPNKFRKIAFNKIEKYGEPNNMHHLKNSKYKWLYYLLGWRGSEMLRKIKYFLYS